MPMNEDLWFEEHQSLLLAMANTIDGRDLLCIDKNLPPIVAIAKNYARCFLDIKGDGTLLKLTEFRIGSKWANVIRYRWPEFVKMAKEFYSHKEFGLHKHDLTGFLAATVSTFYPDPHPESTSVDGRAYRSGVDQTWVNLTADDGNNSDDNVGNFAPLNIHSSTTSDQYARSDRVFTLFDISSINTDRPTVATYDIFYYSTFSDGLSGASSLNSQMVLLETSPASDTAIASADYQNGHATAHGVDLGRGISQADIDTAGKGYADPITLNADGLELIAQANVARLGVTSAWDFDQTTTGLTWSSGALQYTLARASEQTGTTEDPKLVITHEANQIVLTDVTNKRVWQRVSGSASIPVEGTYSVGTPTTIEVKVLFKGTSNIKHDWTVLDAAPTGGTFTGDVTVGEGGMFDLRVRFSNDTTVIDKGTNEFGVGALFGCIGQSNMGNVTTNSGWFGNGTDLTADATLKMYDGVSGWEDALGNGALAFGNPIIAALGVPVGLFNFGVASAALREEAEAAPGKFWLNTAASSIYDDFKVGVDANGGELEGIIYHQGERDASSGVVTQEEYTTSYEDFITDQLRADFTNRSGESNLPVFVVTLGRHTIADDDDWQGIRNAQKSLEGSVADSYVACQATDLALADTVHITATDLLVEGARVAQAVLDILGSEMYHRGPYITGFAEFDSNNIDVTIVHRGGTDFTPTSAITGFEVFDDGTPLTITAAVRQSATVIRITVSETIAGVVTGRYLWGANPTVTSPVLDDTALNLPLEFYIGLEATPIPVIMNQLRGQGVA